MSEDRPTISPDADKPTFGIVVEEAIDDLGRALGNSPAFTEIAANVIQSVRDEKPLSDLVYFDDGGKSYGVSLLFRETDGYIPDDAVTLIEGANTLFFQTSHSELNGEIRGDAELIVGDDVYSGQAAIDHAPDVFPRFFPPLKIRTEERLRHRALMEEARKSQRKKAA